MYSILLAIIYLAFISLGLPDSLIGAGWPVMHAELGVPFSYAGVLSVIISAGGITSSLLSERLIKKAGTGLVTSVSVLLTAVALFGFSASNSFWVLCVLAIPYGLGAGAVDAALNNYIALHYTSRHMSWLHCFWGVGATTSPLIMGYCLTQGLGWHSGFKTVAIIQIVLTLILFSTLSMWKKNKAVTTAQKDTSPPLKISETISIKGVKFILAALFGYCALEGTAGLWASSFLVSYRDVIPETAARYASLFYLGITGGRFLCGFVSNKIGNRNMVRIGIAVIAAGILAVFAPISSNILCLNGLIVIGLGCAPVYPSILHATPENFGKESSQAIIGVQMACGGIGAFVMPPLFGFLADKTSFGIYPLFLLVMAGLVAFMTERLNRKLRTPVQ